MSNRTDDKHNEYREQNKKVKEIKEKAKEESWVKFVEQINKNSNENQKLFYKGLKSIRTDRINNEERKLLTEEAQIKERLKQHFQK